MLTTRLRPESLVLSWFLLVNTFSSDTGAMSIKVTFSINALAINCRAFIVYIRINGVMEDYFAWNGGGVVRVFNADYVCFAGSGMI